jgi:DNA-binding LacI/PurR family transcriptional regulator
MKKRPTATSRPPNSHDVARLAGVSRSAVSRCYTPGAYVSESTRQKVERAAASLKYQPNLLAKSLVTRKSSIIGLALSDIDNQHYPAVVQQLSEALADSGYRLLLFITHGRIGPDPLLDEVLRYRLAGLILASSSRSSSLAIACQTAGLPVVMINNVDTNCRINSVSATNVEGASAVADFLVAAGHRRMAFIAGIEGESTNDERAQGFAGRLAELGLPEPQVAVGAFTWQGASEAVRSLLRGRRPPEALFCANDHMALAALQVSRAEFGLQPGRDISIVGFDDLPISAWPSVSLTTFSHPTSALVAETLASMAGGPALDVHLRVPGELIVRDSARLPGTRARSPIHRSRD